MPSDLPLAVLLVRPFLPIYSHISPGGFLRLGLVMAILLGLKSPWGPMPLKINSESSMNSPQVCGPISRTTF